MLVVGGLVRIYVDHGVRPPCKVCSLTYIDDQEMLVVGGVGSPCVCVCLCMKIFPPDTNERQWISAPRMPMEAPLFAPPSTSARVQTVLSSWSLVVIFALIARGTFKPELEF